MDKNLGFIAALPGDIVLKIFSYMSQQDCLTCMATCRAWDREIPEYSQQVWRRLVIEPSDAHKNDQRRERCLGSHVKHVDIYATDESQLYFLMQRLVSWGCTKIESLELRIHRFTADQDAFITALRKLAPDLVHLLIAGSQSVTLLPYVLNAYPELTHFKSRRTGGLQHRNRTIIPIDRDTKIKYLHLDYPMDKAQLECILRKCPDLRCFGIDQRFLELSHSPSFDLDLLFSWCPKITYLSTNFVSNYGQLQEADGYMSDHVGIRYVNITDRYPRDQMARFLEQSQNTLEVLAMAKYSDQFDNDLSSVFQSFHLSQLHTLAMHNTCIDAESFVVLLNHCPSLVKLELVHPSLTLDSPAIRRLTPMNNLRSLLFMAILDDELSLLTALERFPALETLNVCATCLTIAIPSHCKSPTELKHLKLDGITWKYGHEMDKGESVGSFLEYLVKNSSLERISIRIEDELSLGYKAVQALAMVPTLKVLSLHVNITLQDDEFVKFIRMLGGTVIEVLDLSNTNDISFAVLDALAALPFLNRFASSVGMSSGPKRFQRVNKNGLQHMLCKSPNLTDVCFDAMVLEDSGVSLTRGQIEDLMEQQIPRCHGSRAGSWEARDLSVYAADKTEYRRNRGRVVVGEVTCDVFIRRRG